MLKFELSARQLRAVLFLIIVIDLLLIAMNAPFLFAQSEPTSVAQLVTLVDFLKYQLDLKREGVLAVWFSSALLLLAGMLALLSSATEPVATRFRRTYKVGWLAVGFFFIALSADEIGQVHESVAPYLRSTGALVRVGAGDWIILLFPLILVAVVGLILFFSLIFAREKKPLVITLAAVCCWIGAVSFEAMEARLIPLEMSRAMQAMFEEGLEIIGTTLFCAGFVTHLRMVNAAGSITESKDKAAKTMK